MVIKECLSPNEIRATFPVMKQLRPKLVNEEDYLQLVQNLKKTEEYRLVAMFDDDSNCVVVLGFRIKRSLFSDGKPEMQVDDLVTDISHRSHGFGKKIFTWLKSECKKLDSASITLDSGTQRTDAHKFYYRENMKVTALHFLWSPKG